MVVLSRPMIRASTSYFPSFSLSPSSSSFQDRWTVTGVNPGLGVNLGHSPTSELSKTVTGVYPGLGVNPGHSPTSDLSKTVTGVNPGLGVNPGRLSLKTNSNKSLRLKESGLKFPGVEFNADQLKPVQLTTDVKMFGLDDSLDPTNLQSDLELKSGPANDKAVTSTGTPFQKFFFEANVLEKNTTSNVEAFPNSPPGCSYPVSTEYKNSCKEEEHRFSVSGFLSQVCQSISQSVKAAYNWFSRSASELFNRDSKMKKRSKRKPRKHRGARNAKKRKSRKLRKWCCQAIGQSVKATCYKFYRTVTKLVNSDKPKKKRSKRKLSPSIEVQVLSTLFPNNPSIQNSAHPSIPSLVDLTGLKSQNLLKRRKSIPLKKTANVDVPEITIKKSIGNWENTKMPAMSLSRKCRN